MRRRNHMLIAHLIATVALLVATHVDLKIREVPDLISYSTMSAGVILAILNTVSQVSLQPLFLMVGGLALGALIGLVMYYAGQWGGGDAKLLMGLGSLWGATTFFYEFLLFLIIAGAIYGLLYGMYLAYKRREEFKKAYKKIAYKKHIKYLRIGFQLFVAIALVLGLFIITDTYLRLLVVILAAGIYLLFHAWIFAKALEEGCMKRKIPIKDLVEGDWVLEEIKIGKKKIEIANYGITKEQIAQVQKSKIKTVLVKEGIPFVPSFLLAYIFTIITTNIGVSFWALI